MAIATYNYRYGGGAEPNRHITFFRSIGTDPKTIKASVEALISGNNQPISCLSGDQITVEMMSTSEKVQALKLRRDGIEALQKPDQPLSDLSIDKQNAILEGLTPNGPWRLGISNAIGENRLEKVVHLTLFNTN